MENVYANICHKTMIFGKHMHINEIREFWNFHKLQASLTSMVTLYLKKGLMKDFNFWSKYSYLMYILLFW